MPLPTGATVEEPSEAGLHARAIERFLTAFGAATDAVMADDTGKVIAVTGSVAEGVAVPGRLLVDLVHGATSDDLAACVESVLEAHDVSASAYLRLGDGSAIVARLFTLLSEDGSRRYLIGVLSLQVDRAELSRLRRTDQVYELWFERAPTGVCLVGVEGGFQRANPAFCRLVGRSETTLQSLTFLDITHPDDVEMDVAKVQQLLSGELDRYEIDKRYVRPDAEVVWVHLTVALASDDDGRPLNFIAMVEDITARRRAESELRRAFDFQNILFDSAPVAMAELAVDGTMLRVNTAAGNLAGCEPAQLIGRRTVDLGEGDAAAAVRHSLARLASGEIGASIDERKFRDFRGRVRSLLVHTAGLRGLDGSIDRVLLQVIDVTEARELNDRLQASVERLSIAYREKAALISSLSHDLRTPLAALRIMAELLADDAALSPDKRRDVANRLLAEAKRTEGVLADMVVSERTISGLISPRRGPVEMTQLARRVVARYLDPFHRIELVSGARDATVIADGALLDRMIDNLVANAFRHTPTGTEVTVGVTASDDDVEIIVDDNGPGVPDQMKDLVFEPYVRAGRLDRPGSGVGLFLVRQFAGFHGGTAVCLDRPGGGARFVVRIPRSVEGGEASGPP